MYGNIQEARLKPWSVSTPSELIAVNQDSLGKAGGLVANATCPGEKVGACQIWLRPLSDGSHVAALYNGGGVGHNITVDFAKLVPRTQSDHMRVRASTTYTVRDLWKHSSTTVNGSVFTAAVDSHGAAVLQFRARDEPLERALGA
jgi:hypothetical protein